MGRTSGRRSATSTGRERKPPTTGPATWTELSVRVNGPPKRSAGRSETTKSVGRNPQIARKRLAPSTRFGKTLRKLQATAGRTANGDPSDPHRTRTRSRYAPPGSDHEVHADGRADIRGSD